MWHRVLARWLRLRLSTASAAPIVVMSAEAEFRPRITGRSLDAYRVQGGAGRGGDRRLAGRYSQYCVELLRSFELFCQRGGNDLSVQRGCQTAESRDQHDPYASRATKHRSPPPPVECGIRANGHHQSWPDPAPPSFGGIACNSTGCSRCHRTVAPFTHDPRRAAARRETLCRASATRPKRGGERCRCIAQRSIAASIFVHGDSSSAWVLHCRWH